MPSWNDELWPVLRLIVAPGAAASLLVMLALRCLGTRWTPLAAALAFAAGVLTANHFRPDVLNLGQTLKIRDTITVLGWSLEAKPERTDEDQAAAEGDLAVPPTQYWFPWLAGLALVIELSVRLFRLPAGAGWATRTALALFAARLLTPAHTRLASPWASWALGLAMILEWAVLVKLAERWKDGVVALGLACCFGAAAMVLLQAATARLSEMALFCFAALLGPALVSWKWSGDTGSVMGAVAVLLPGLMLVGQQETFVPIPWYSFALAGLAPIALAPLLLPFWSRRLDQQPGWKRCLLALGLLAIPATAAVILALLATGGGAADPGW